MKIENYTQGSTKQYLWQGCLQDENVLIYDLFQGQERQLNYFFSGKKAKILKRYPILNLYDIIDENTFVFFDSKTQQLDFVCARKNRLGKYIIKKFFCVSLWDGKDRVEKNIYAPEHPLVTKVPVRAFIHYGTSYYYVKYEDKNYILFYNQEKDGFVFVPVPEKEEFTDKNGHAGASHIWKMVNNGVYPQGNISLAQTLLINWDKIHYIFLILNLA